MSADPPPWREFTYPLNVFMHILTHEEGGVSWLHYGLFESAGEPLAAAQARSTELLLSRLPPPPARLLEVGIGLGTTLRRLLDEGYDAVGITPDASQIAMVRGRFGKDMPVHCVAFEDFSADGLDRSGEGGGQRTGAIAYPCDVLVFQESSQYIDAEALFARAATLAPRIVLLDEFSLAPLVEEGSLPSRDDVFRAAARHGYRATEELDLSAKAAPTMSYFTDRIPAYRERLIGELGLSNEQIDALVESGARYRERYANGTYGYRLVCFLRNDAP